MLLKNENASLKLEFVNYEFPEAGRGTDAYDQNWLLLRCTWVDEEGYTHKDSNACLLAQELAGMNAGLKVLLAGIRDRYDSDFIEPDFSLVCRKSGRHIPNLRVLLPAQHHGRGRYGRAGLHSDRRGTESGDRRS